VRASESGNSLAIRPPTVVAETLEVKKPDEIEVRVVGEQVFPPFGLEVRSRGRLRLRELGTCDFITDWRSEEMKLLLASAYIAKIRS
jgi:hypothetical protein